MRELDDLFKALARSPFRQRFNLQQADAAYLRRKTLPVVLEHAERFIRDRLAPAAPENDGRQTPMRGHPVFPAQHATATCCRGCLSKWHYIQPGRALTEDEIQYVLQVIECWLIRHREDSPTPQQEEDRQKFLF